MKKHKNRAINFFVAVPPWIFFAIVVASGFFAVYQLRMNNERMIELRQAVYEADKSGSDVQIPLRELQAYVTRHMNTNLQSGPNSVYPPIQLKYTYERLVQAEVDKAKNANSSVYTDAQAYCEKLNSRDFSGRNRVPCIQQYVSTHTTQGTKTIPDALYKFSFVSPRWSPDLAGWSIFIAALSFILFIVSLIFHKVIKHHWL